MSCNNITKCSNILTFENTHRPRSNKLSNKFAVLLSSVIASLFECSPGSPGCINKTKQIPRNALKNDVDAK